MTGRRGLFVTGTDTGVGKTIASAALLAGAPDALQLGYWKPVQAGDDDDAAMVAALAQPAAGTVVGPVARFALPASPHHAAEAEHRRVGVSDLMAAWRDMPSRPYLVEGAGGWMVPLNREELWSDFVRPAELPVLVVASTRLGCINHTLLTLTAVGARAVGVIMVGPYDPSAWTGIGAHTQVPILGHLEDIPGFGPGDVRRWGRVLWSGPLASALTSRWSA